MQLILTPLSFLAVTSLGQSSAFIPNHIARAAPAPKAVIHGGGSGKSPVSGVVAPPAPLKPKYNTNAGLPQSLSGLLLAPQLDFDGAVIKGKEVWKKLQDALKDYPPDKPVSLDGLKTNGWTVRDFPATPAPRNLANIYKHLMLSSTDKDYVLRMATHSVPGAEKPTLYGNIYDATDGVVIADDNRKAKGEKTKLVRGHFHPIARLGTR